ncbi:MAG: hypothetical protein ACXWPM_02605 [Bdellovibrionota bacterium]
MRTIPVAILIALVPTLVHAEGADHAGNGGAAIACRDAGGNVQKAYLLDTWEGANLPWKENNYQPFPIVHDSVSTREQQIAHALHKISLSSDYAYRKVKEAVEDVTKRLQIRPFKMKQIPDSNDFALPDEPGLDCQREQLANYTEQFGIIVNERIWNRLDATDQAALVLHEAIYKLDREPPTSATTSDHARKFVAYLFSSLPMPYSLLGDLAVICRQVDFSVEHAPDNAFIAIIYGTGDPYFGAKWNPTELVLRAYEHQSVNVCGTINSPSAPIVVRTQEITKGLCSLSFVLAAKDARSGETLNTQRFGMGSSFCDGWTTESPYPRLLSDWFSFRAL